MHVNKSECIETKRDFTRSCEIPLKRPGGGPEQTISRILCLHRLASNTGSNHLSRMIVHFNAMLMNTRELEIDVKSWNSVKTRALFHFHKKHVQILSACSMLLDARVAGTSERQRELKKNDS
jgi:hypothetical protein